MPENDKDPDFRYSCPLWIWQVVPKLFPTNIKHLYAYLCLFGQQGNWQWNCRLEAKFHCSKATIKRRLKWLHDHHLIAITSPKTPYRRIHPRFHISKESWIRECIVYHRKKPRLAPTKPKPKIVYKAPVDFKIWAAEKMAELKNRKRLKSEPL